MPDHCFTTLLDSLLERCVELCPLCNQGLEPTCTNDGDYRHSKAQCPAFREHAWVAAVERIWHEATPPIDKPAQPAWVAPAQEAVADLGEALDLMPKGGKR